MCTTYNYLKKLKEAYYKEITKNYKVFLKAKLAFIFDLWFNTVEIVCLIKF